MPEIIDITDMNIQQICETARKIANREETVIAWNGKKYEIRKAHEDGTGNIPESESR